MPKKTQYFDDCEDLVSAMWLKKGLSKRFHPDSGSDEANEETMKEINAQFDAYKAKWKADHGHTEGAKKHASRSPYGDAVMSKFAIAIAFANEIGRVEKQDGDIILTIDITKLKDSLAGIADPVIIEMALAGIMSKIKSKK